MGHGVKSVIIWRTKSPLTWEERVLSLRSDQEPSQAQIFKSAKYLRIIGWDEVRAKLEMK
jgi:hypothetical protein